MSRRDIYGARLLDIAREAGRRILSHYGAAATVKADGSPVTAADRAANDRICAELARLWPAIPIVSEEALSGSFEERAGWSSFWLVDPLDGTREFLQGTGEFTVNIALIEGCSPVASVVHAPATGESWIAFRAEGAFGVSATGASTRLHTSPCASPPRAAVSRSHSGDRELSLFRRLGGVEAVPSGSSLKFCLVAEGKADLYPRFGTTMEWDTAAAQLVLEEAGGIVITPKGELRYNKEDLKNPSFIACGNADISARCSFDD